MELSTGSISDPSGENYEGQAKNTFVQSTGFSENSVGGGRHRFADAVDDRMFNRAQKRLGTSAERTFGT